MTLVACAWLAPLPGRALIVADDAQDVCEATLDPCVVSDVVTIVSGATLDFGTRAIEITPTGRFDAVDGNAEILCGELRADAVGAVAIQARAGAGGDGGHIRIEARRRCSSGGAACLRDSDCSQSTCSLGSGKLDLSASARADGVAAGSLTFVAAGDLIVGGDLNAAANGADSDGGAITLVSEAGVVQIEGLLSAASGRSGQGGTVSLAAAADVFLGGEIDVSGGEFDGGFVTIDATRDVTIAASVHASATRLDGAGGEIAIFAGRDLSLVGGVTLQTDGSRGADFAGDGGLQSYSAGRNVAVAAASVLRSDGARPDAAGGSIEIHADGAVSVEGQVLARGLGPESSGGDVDLAACVLVLETSAVIENAGSLGSNRLAGTARVVLEAGSRMTAAADGANVIVYGNASVPPRIEGTVTPAADEILDADLPPCESGPTTTTTLTTTTTIATTTTLPNQHRCGDGFVEGSEQCDSGGVPWTIGAACRGDCTLVGCGDPDDSGTTSALDALFALRAAVGSRFCAPCVCDVDATGGPPRSGDALRILRAAVGLPLELLCSPCE